MPMHDWTRVESGIYHHFHQLWASRIMEALNGGVLPPEFYALVEQVAVRRKEPPAVPDVLTLRTREDDTPGPAGGVATALLAPPKTSVMMRGDMEVYRRRKNVVTVRHAAGDHVVAVVELVSPGNKSGRQAFREFVEKAADLLDRRVHLLLLDPFVSTPRDPNGIHAALWEHLYDEPYSLPPAKPLTFAGYESAEYEVHAYIEHLAVGDPLPDMPLFLVPDGCVMVPLEATYTSAFGAVPERWRKVITAV